MENAPKHVGAAKPQVWEPLVQWLESMEPMILIATVLGFIVLSSALVYLAARRRRKEPPIKKAEEPAAPPKAVSTLPQDVADIRATDQSKWLENLHRGLSKTRLQLVDKLSGIFSRQAKLDEDLLEELHEILFRADLGVETADKLVEGVRKSMSGRSDAPSWDEVKLILEEEILAMLALSQQPMQKPSQGPMVILIVGVNGVGKTTSIGKLAAHFLAQDQKVLLAAGDTFRAAAIDQLNVWAERLGCDIIKHQANSDPAAVAYDAVKAALAREYDVLLIDTAGRLHNKKELMDELAKIRRVIGKDLPEAPHETWLVIDATTGQNAFQQVKAFREVCPLSGLVVTKLDGTAKGGVIIGASDRFELPIRYVGVGEKAADLRAFKPEDFVKSLF